jgi:hypothetical protein
MFFLNDKWYNKYHEITDQERNGDLLGHYIGCKKPHKKIKKNVNLMNI